MDPKLMKLVTFRQSDLCSLMSLSNFERWNGLVGNLCLSQILRDGMDLQVIYAFETGEDLMGCWGFGFLRSPERISLYFGFYNIWIWYTFISLCIQNYSVAVYE